MTALAPAVAQADSWAGPKVGEAFSASREHFVRIVPGESIGDTHGFAGAKKGRYATAEFYRRQLRRRQRPPGDARQLAQPGLGRRGRALRCARPRDPLVPAERPLHDWRERPAYVRQDQKALLVTVRSGADFLFDLETGGYKYCEPHEKTWRCRSGTPPR